MTDDYRLLLAGDTALVVEFGDRIDRALNDRVIALAAALEARPLEGIVETVPTFRSLLVQYEPLVLSHDRLVAHLHALLAAGTLDADTRGRRWRLPICYDEALAPDLAEVAERCGLPAAAVIERHAAVDYHVYMLGFLPGQPYMGDLDAGLALPRRPSPRARIAPGSVAVAMRMTSIFPFETPCGWHLIGRSPVPLWDPRGGGLPLLAAGDRVCFEPVDLTAFEHLAARAAEGRLALAPEAEPEPEPGEARP